MARTTDRQDRIARYRRRLATEPGANVFVPLGDLLAAAGEVDEALATLEAGLARKPDSLPARVVLGRVLMTAGRRERAREVLGEVLAADPDNLEARRLLAEDDGRQGEWDRAAAHYEQLARLEPGEERWAAALAEARTRAEGAGGGEDGGFATMTMVDIYVAQGYHARAAEALRRILAADPGREDARRRLGEVEAAAAEAAPEPRPDGEPDAGSRDRERARRRSHDKAQFAQWLDKLRDDGEEAGS